MSRLCVSLALLLLVAPLSGCLDAAYYATLETFGQHKRDILSSRVRSALTAQEEAEEQFVSAYDAFKQAANFDGGELETVYNRINGEYERSEGRADDVRKRIKSIERVAADLFAEWEQEIELISDRGLRSKSRQQLGQTQGRYDELIRVMKRAESRMDPVLTAFRDRVLFLKHNLNAQAIASLAQTSIEIEGDVDRLVRDMRESIRQAEGFLQSFNS